jgi:hypothetical protein
VAMRKSPQVAKHKSPYLARRAEPEDELDGDVDGVSQSPHRPGSSIEVCEGAQANRATGTNKAATSRCHVLR